MRLLYDSPESLLVRTFLGEHNTHALTGRQQLLHSFREDTHVSCIIMTAIFISNNNNIIAFFPLAIRPCHKSGL